MRDLFYNYLVESGYSEYTPSGNESTVNAYCYSIERICEMEKIS